MNEINQTFFITKELKLSTSTMILRFYGGTPPRNYEKMTS